MLFDDLFLLLPFEIQEQLKQSPQDRLYHSEGSVYNHIKLVSMQLPENDINYQLCALLHDINKINCVEAKEKIDKIRIRNIGHDKNIDYSVIQNEYFMDYSIDHNFHKSIDWSFIKQVCNNHMRMHDYNSGKISRPNKRKAMEELKYYEELKIFSKADSEGRIDGNTTVAPPYLIICYGNSGSGKSTWAKSFAEHSGYIRICPDEIREKLTGSISDQTKNGEVFHEAFHTLKEELNNKHCVIFDSTAVNIKTRKSLETIATECGAIVMYKVFNVDKEECKRRILEDITNGVNRSNTPNEIIDKFDVQFQETLVWLVENNKLVIKE